MKAVLIFVLVASIAITAFPLVIKDIVLDGLHYSSACGGLNQENL